MKYKKNKLRLNETASAIQGFYFLVKFGLVLLYVLKVYRKKFSSILLRKNMFNSVLAFSFEKHISSQDFKDFSVENLKTTPSNFLNFFSEIYLSPIINYSGSIFTLYLTWGVFSLVCVVSIFFFLSFFFFLRLWLTAKNLFSECFMIRYQESMWPRSDSFLGHTKMPFRKFCSTSCYLQRVPYDTAYAQ